MVNRVFRHEDLEAAVQLLCTRTGVELPEELPRVRPTEYERPFRQYYRADDKALVERVWAEDFETFGYDSW